jgi:hypothetical protein
MRNFYLEIGLRFARKPLLSSNVTDRSEQQQEMVRRESGHGKINFHNDNASAYLSYQW